MILGNGGLGKSESSYGLSFPAMCFQYFIAFAGRLNRVRQ